MIALDLIDFSFQWMNSFFKHIIYPPSLLGFIFTLHICKMRAPQRIFDLFSNFESVNIS